jgi:molybdenum cofactor cytidylyltransferase
MNRPPAADADPGPVAVAVLAAGGSARLGRAKQLVEWRGTTLLRRAAETAVRAACGPIVLVLGARSARLHRELAGLPVEVAVNERWQDGLAGSIRTALGRVRTVAPGASGILLTLADQPLVTCDLLRTLVARHRQHPRRPVACAYGDTVGAPALLPRYLFAEIDELRGDSGARSILRRHRQEVLEIAFPDGACDIDTDADLNDLVAHGGAGSE